MRASSFRTHAVGPCAVDDETPRLPALSVEAPPIQGVFVSMGILMNLPK